MLTQRSGPELHALGIGRLAGGVGIVRTVRAIRAACAFARNEGAQLSLQRARGPDLARGGGRRGEELTVKLMETEARNKIDDKSNTNNKNKKTNSNKRLKICQQNRK